jgi:serine/threonine protein kinase
MIVVKFMRGGNLRDYLKMNNSRIDFGRNSPRIDLKEKINFINQISHSLVRIHENNLIHRGLHSGNILIFYTGEAYIGLNGSTEDKSSEKVYEIMPYVAPEVLSGKGDHTEKSDVYSLGMLMWEIFAGYPPFHDVPHDIFLILGICAGKRPPILSGIPPFFEVLIKCCWHDDPLERPTAEEVNDLIYNEYIYPSL